MSTACSLHSSHLGRCRAGEEGKKITVAIFSMAINKILFYFQKRQEHREDSSERLAWGTEILQKENFIWQNHSHGPVKGLLPAPTATFMGVFYIFLSYAG